MLSASRRHPHVTHLDQVPTRHERHGRFGFDSKRLWTEASGRRLACTWFELPPGKQAFPHHFHAAFEEAVFVLEGTGAARIGDERIPIAAGDYIAYPPGPETAHSIINTSDGPLRYLCFSTVDHLDIVVYPDSEKVAFKAGVDPAKPLSDQTPWAAGRVKIQPPLGYYEGEDEE